MGSELLLPYFVIDCSYTSKNIWTLFVMKLNLFKTPHMAMKRNLEKFVAELRVFGLRINQYIMKL